MTRVTNFGRKRTYVEAGFEHDPKEAVGTPALPAAQGNSPNFEEVSQANATAAAPPKKKRKRTPKSKRDGNTGTKNVVSIEGGKIQADLEGGEAQANVGPKTVQKSKGTMSKRVGKEKITGNFGARSRREKRIAERQAGTTCFACREQGHAAKDCPVVARNNTDGTETGKGKSKDIIGICYRCGSKKHTLSRCKKPVDSSNPLPFASCFVCSGKGHLASSCPQNRSKGIYPNGGSCKLCGDTTHLAKNCGLRKGEIADTNMLFGTGREAGADEDDFHSFKRRENEVDREEQQEDKLKTALNIKAGAYSGVVKSFGKPVTTTKKVVFF